MKKLIAFALVLALAAGFLTGLIFAQPIQEEPGLPVFDAQAIAAGTALAPAEVSHWNDGILHPVSPEEADGSAYPDILSELDELGGSAGSGGYINDGGRAPMEAMVSFMDDDCRMEVYTELYEQVIVPLELPYTLSVPIDNLDRNKYLATWQLQEMVDSGVTVSCHTLGETSMLDYTLEGLDAMLAQWRCEANELGLGEVLSYAYCNGLWRDEVMSAVKSHFRMGFTVEPGVNRMPFESFYMKRVSLFANRAQEMMLMTRDGTYLNANGKVISAAPGQRVTTLPIMVQEGEEYLLTCSAVWKGRCYGVYSKNGVLLDSYQVPDTASGALLTDHKVRIPAGASYMIVSHNLTVYGDTEMTVRQLPAESTLHAAKAYVDQVAEDGGWLIFMTHAWYEWFDAEDLIELVDYIRQAGIPIVDVNEAIRTSGNIIETGIFHDPGIYSAAPYFVVSADGRVYTNSIEIPDVPEEYENVPLTLRSRRVILNGRSVPTNAAAVEYVVSEPVDVRNCQALLITGWAYDQSSGAGNGYQIYAILDEKGRLLDSYTATTAYAAGGDRLDHQYVELPEGAAAVIVAGNVYETMPELTRITGTDG